MKKEIPWHNLSLEKVVKKLNSDIEQGLSLNDVEKRQKEFGKNLLPREKPLAKTKIILNQFKSPLIYILLLAGIVVLFFKEFTDAIVIFAAVFLNTIVGFWQENKANKALLKLKRIIKIKAKVVREGNIKLVDSSEIVPGDIFVLSPGDKVPADGRIIESRGLKINEMALTGEWISAEKKEKILPENTPLADRDNMVYMGTIVEDGKGKAIATHTGLATEIGKVVKIMKETKEEKTPLQRKVSRLARVIGIIIGIICLVILIEGVMTGNDFLEIFITAVAVAVAAIPEGLPVALTVILALGMQRILKKKGLVRKLLAAETLGSTSIICTDKTLTLTEGKMRVSEIFEGRELLDGKKEDHSLSLKIASLANEAFVENPEESIEKWIVRGRPTDRALLLAGIETGFNRKEFEKRMKKIGEIPFNSLNKYLAIGFETEKKEKIFYFSGAPEKLLKISGFLKVGKNQISLDKRKKEKIRKKMEEMTGKGLRVIGVAYKKTKKLDNFLKKPENLIFVGLIGLKDPIRKEAKEAIKICREAGMRPIIVTGDHKLTALAVARELGFRVKEKNIMTGGELEELSDKELKEKIREIQIFARVEPKHKMRIINAWQERGEVVAMTGDGINDAPAIKKADIGIALGSGTEVAKEVSDLVLLTDNFNVIVAAVEEGRAIIDNIRKVITYLLSDSFTETILIGVGLLLGYPLPISAVQILWVNFIEDGLPSISLAFEPDEKDLMKRRPEPRNLSLLTKEMKVIILGIGIITDLILLAIFFWLWKRNHDIAYVRTMIFAALSIDSIFYVFSCRSLRKNIWHINLFSNKLLVFSWVFGIIMLIAALYFPPLQTLLKTVPLEIWDWLILGGLGLTEFFLIESVKYLFIKNKRNIRRKRV